MRGLTSIERLNIKTDCLRIGFGLTVNILYFGELCEDHRGLFLFPRNGNDLKNPPPWSDRPLLYERSFNNSI